MYFVKVVVKGYYWFVSCCVWCVYYLFVLALFGVLLLFCVGRVCVCGGGGGGVARRGLLYKLILYLVIYYSVHIIYIIYIYITPYTLLSFYALYQISFRSHILTHSIQSRNDIHGEKILIFTNQRSQRERERELHKVDHTHITHTGYIAA